MPVSRTKKIRFINEFGTYALMKAVEAAFIRNGPDWLTDDQLSEIVSEQVKQARRQAKWNLKSREQYRQRMERAPRPAGNAEIEEATGIPVIDASNSTFTLTKTGRRKLGLE